MMTPSSKVYCTTKGGIKEEKQYFMPGGDSKIGINSATIDQQKFTLVSLPF